MQPCYVGIVLATELPLGSTLTLHAWAELPEDAEGELVDGVLVDDEMTDAVHEVVVAALVELLRGWARPRGALVLGSELKLAVSDGRGRKADVAVYFAGAPRPAPRGLVHTAPSLVVEVVSSRPRDIRRDRVEKMDEYAVFGVAWYWIVDPQLRSVEIFERAPEGRYARALARVDGRIEQVPGCEGLALDVAALWAELDELGA
jgi:Uma2 family endonuclease